ncbi:sugar ABC transporter permease [Clostridia bacterium]|nr:sugar ABC transporter permease [Clostridia bacterium]
MTAAITPKHKGSLSKRIYRQRWAYVLLSPVLLGFLFFHYFPMYGIQLAFKDFVVRKGISGSPWVGLKHYTTMFGSQIFRRAFVNTIIISLMRLLFGFPTVILFAIMINEIRYKHLKSTVQTLSYLPHFLSWVILGGIMRDILSVNYGILNYFLELMGMPKKFFLTEPAWFRSILVITGLWKEIGWGSIIYLAAIAGISAELYEAAEIDGASRVRIIRHIILPGLMSVISIQFILQLGGVLNAGFDQIFNLYNSLVYSTGDIIDTYVYRVGLTDKLQYSLATAVGLLKNIIGLTLVVGTNAIVRRLGEGDHGIW